MKIKTYLTQTNRMKVGIVGPLLILPMLFSGMTGCTTEQTVAQQVPPPPTVTVSTPVQQLVTNYAEFTGSTEASESVTIQARVEGVLEEIHFKAGAVVNKGDLLYKIDAKPYQARLDEVRATLAIARAELKLAQATTRRRENAFKDKAVSEVAVIEAQANLTAAQAAVAAATATVNNAELELSYTRITAPISGRIGRSHVDVGNLIEDGENTTLTTILQIDPIYAYFSISEQELLKYKEQLNAHTSSMGAEGSVNLRLADKTFHPFKGQIDFIDNRLDNDTGTILIRAVFPNSDHNLLPGLFSSVRVSMGKENQKLLVPDSALGRDQQGHYLLVAGPDNIVQQLSVTTGSIVNGMRIIEKGLSLEDRVIIKGLQKAHPGTLVTTVANDQLTASAAGSGSPSA